MGVDLRRQARRIDELDARALGELLQGLAKLDALDTHVEGEDIAAAAAAKAMEVARLREDDEGGGLFLMERAETLVGSPGLLELNVVGDEVDDLGAVPHLRDGIPGHVVVLPGETVAPRSDGPMVRDEDRFVELDRVAVGHARHEIGDAPRGFFVAAGSVLRRKAFGVFEEVRVERADDVLRPLRVRVFVERSVHLTEEELPQRVGGLLHMGRDARWRRALTRCRNGRSRR